MAQRGMFVSVAAMAVAGGVLWWPVKKTIQDRAVAGHFERSETLSKQGRWDEATVELREAVRLDPDHNEARDALGVLLSEMGKIDEAKLAYDAGIARRPKDEFLLFKAASVMFGAKRYKDTIAYAEQAAAASPLSRQFIYLQALSLERLGRADEAHALFVEGLRQSPDDPMLKRSAERTRPGQPQPAKSEKAAPAKPAAKPGANRTAATYNSDEETQPKP